jgi:hypothetical protein
MDLGLEWAGFETAWQVEINPFARDVLKKHWPDVPKFTDVRNCGKHNLEPVDIISGGYPCQDHSIAGKKRGLGTPDNPTERSGLWFEYKRIIRELRPRWVLIENVAQLLRTADGDTVLSAMEGIGYSCWPLVVGADILGAPHKRERAWILCRDRAHERPGIDAVTAVQWALPPECQRKMEGARERWDYWKGELGRGVGQGYFPATSTPTALQVVQGWLGGGRFHMTASGRARKLRRSGKDSSMPWAQEMLVRTVLQKNPMLVPTPETLEEFMGFPSGWTDLGVEPAGCPLGWACLADGEPDADAYATIRRGLRGIPDLKDRFRALGNAVVPQIPMSIGAYVQCYESHAALPAQAGTREFKEDNLSESFPAQDMSGPQTRAESARVGVGYESLDVEGTKKAFEELNGVLDKLATTVVQTLEQVVPCLAKMQSLLSQRGADRKKVLRRAGLPKWTQWAKTYAGKLDRSLRTVQDHIKHFRTQQAGVGGGLTGKAKSRGNGERLRLDGRQQVALVKAQLAANDLAAALKHGAEWQTPLAEYEKVAVAPASLDSYLDALSPEPDWKAVLANLVSALETCGDTLPVAAKNAMHAAQALLGGKGKTEATRTKPASPKATPCPADQCPVGEGGKLEKPDPACFPAAIAKDGTVMHGTGGWGVIDTAEAREAA